MCAFYFLLGHAPARSILRDANVMDGDMVYCFPMETSSHSRPPPTPFNFIVNESAGIHHGHIGPEGGERKSFDIQRLNKIDFVKLTMTYE